MSLGMIQSVITTLLPCGISSVDSAKVNGEDLRSIPRPCNLPTIRSTKNGLLIAFMIGGHVPYFRHSMWHCEQLSCQMEEVQKFSILSMSTKNDTHNIISDQSMVVLRSITSRHIKTGFFLT